MFRSRQSGLVTTKLAVEDIIGSERVGTIRRYGRWIDLAVVCAAALVVLTFWSEENHFSMVGWLILVATASAARAAMSWAYRIIVMTEPARRQWQSAFYGLTLAVGVFWGSAGWLFFEPESIVHQVALMMLMFSMATLPAMALLTNSLVFTGYLFALFAPLLVRLILEFNALGTLLAMACLGIIGVLMLLARTGGQEIIDDLHFRLAYRRMRGRLDNEITTRVRYESDMRSEKERVRRKDSKLLEIAMDPRINAGDLRAACELISDHSAQATGSPLVSIWFMTPDGGALRCVHANHNGKHKTRAFMDIEREAFASLYSMLHNTRAVLVQDISRDSRITRVWKNYFRSHHSTSALFVPFRNGHVLRGIILHEWSQDRKEWTPGDVDFASSLADFMTVAISAADRRNAQEEMRKLASSDRLTNLPNRSVFMDRLEQALAHARRNQQKLALLFIDIDRFKVINDSLGHHAGDQVLKTLGERLQKCVRTEDVVARFGGDEFMILMENCEDPKAITFTCERINARISEVIKAGQTEVQVGSSIGISMYPADGVDAATLLRNADTAMYRAKEKGRNNYQFYTPDMQAQALLKLSLENSLRKACQRQEFVLYYQPQFDAIKGGVIGVEALLRWQHPEFGLIQPCDFIPLAEETGLIVPISRWVLHEACRQAKTWFNAFDNKHLVMSVNLSVRQFAADGLLKMVKNALDETGLPASCLQLEITESILTDNVDEHLKMLDELKLLGVKLALGDFGVEHSSLLYLKRMPIDSIKIDRAFVQDVTESNYDAAISHCLITLAKRLRLTAVAEGVDTSEQMNKLLAEGCRYMQGYLFSMPLTAEECGNLLCGVPDFAI